MLKDVTTIHVVRGRKRTAIDLTADAPDADDLAAMLLGRSGNLRAPTFKIGRTMLVGFDAELYGEQLL